MFTKFKFPINISSILIIVAIFSSCKKDINSDNNLNFKSVDQFDYKIIHEWNTLWLEIERHAAGYRPGPVSNSLGYVGLANYEACVSGMPSYKSISNLYSGLKIPSINENQEYHWPTADAGRGGGVCSRRRSGGVREARRAAAEFAALRRALGAALA